MSEQFKRSSNVNSVEVVQMIKVNSLVGTGTVDNPVRQITEFYTMDGQLVSCHDWSIGDFVAVPAPKGE